jgi:hypothetical protein
MQDPFPVFASALSPKQESIIGFSGVRAIQQTNISLPLSKVVYTPIENKTKFFGFSNYDNESEQQSDMMRTAKPSYENNYPNYSKRGTNNTNSTPSNNINSTNTNSNNNHSTTTTTTSSNNYFSINKSNNFSGSNNPIYNLNASKRQLWSTAIDQGISTPKESGKNQAFRQDTEESESTGINSAEPQRLIAPQERLRAIPATIVRGSVSPPQSLPRFGSPSVINPILNNVPTNGFSISKRSPSEEAKFYTSNSSGSKENTNPSAFIVKSYQSESLVIKGNIEAIMREKEKAVVLKSELDRAKRELIESQRRVEALGQDINSRNEIHREEVAEARTRFNEQQNIIEALNKQLIDAQSLCSVLNSEKQRLLSIKEENDKLNGKLEKSEGELVKLRGLEKEMRRLVMEQEEIGRRLDEVSTDRIGLERSVIELKSRNNSLEKQIKCYAEEANKLHEELDEKYEKNFKLENERNYEKNENDRLKQQLKALEENLNRENQKKKENIEIVLNELKSELREKTESVFKLSEELEKMRYQLKHMAISFESERVVLIEERERVKVENFTLIQGQSERDMKIEELKFHLVEADSEIKKLEDQRTKQKDIIESLEQTRLVKLSEETALHIERTVLTTPERISYGDMAYRQAAEDWEREAVKRAEQLIGLRDEMIKLERENESKNDRVKQLESNVNQLLEENQRLNEVLLDRLDEISALTMQRREQRAEVTNKPEIFLQTESDVVIEQEAIKKKVDALIEHNKILIATIYQHREELEQKAQEHKDLINRYNNIVVEITELRESFSEYRELFKELKLSNENLQTEKEVTEELLIQLDDNLKMERSRNANLLVEIEEVKRNLETNRNKDIDSRNLLFKEIEIEEHARAQDLLKEIEKYKFACLEMESARNMNEYSKKSLENEIESLKAIIKTDKFEIEKLYNMLDLRRKDFEDVTSKVDAMKSENQSLSLRNNEIRTEVTLLKERLEKRNTELEGLTVENREINKRFQELNVQLVSKNIEIKEKNIIAAELRDKNSKLVAYLKDHLQTTKKSREVLEFI